MPTPPVTPQSSAPADALDAALKGFEFTTARANADGNLSGLTPGAKYHVIQIGTGKKIDIQSPPTAFLSPPRVRRSLLIIVEDDDPAINPIKP